MSKPAHKQIKTTPPKNTSVDPVLQYALDVLSGKEVAGPNVRLSCQRHIDDLADGEERGLWWDQPAADRAMGFFPDVLQLTGGAYEGSPFVLHPAQQFIVGSLFGWKGADGSRRFRVAYVEMGKGNGKSPLAAGIGLYMLTADGEARAEVYSAAVDKDQAKILFRDAVSMVGLSPALSRYVRISGGKDGDATKVWNLYHAKSGSFFRPVASESKGRGKSGFRPYCVLLDEVHEHPTDAMVEYSRKNLKGRPNALALMITNSGVVDAQSVCLRYHEYSERVVNGERDDSFFAYVCGLDKDDHWTDPAVWKKSCPLLGISVPVSYLEQEVRESIGMPSKQSLTRRLNFCEWVGSENPFIEPDVWRQNGGAVSVDALRGRTCYGGLDLSSKNDLTSLTLVFPMDDGSKAVLPLFWTPKDTLRERQEEDRAPYQQWVESKFMIATDGKTIDYRYVAKKIGELQGMFRIKAIAFDRWRIDEMRRELGAEGVRVELVEHGQGFKDMNPSIEALEDALLERRLRHGNHPVLGWCIDNVKAVTDAAGNRKFDKKIARGRIDGAQSLAMAIGISQNILPEKKFQVMFVG